MRPYFIFLMLCLLTHSATAQWIKQDLTTSSTLLAVDFVNGNKGWVAGDGNLIYSTHDGGQHWELFSDYTYPAHETWYDITCLDEKTIYACGTTYNYDRYQSNWTYTLNDGDSWISQNLWHTDRSNWLDVFFIDATFGWRTGQYNTKARMQLTTTGPAKNAWSTVTLPTGADVLYSVRFLDKNNGWAVGSPGIIFHTTDGGNSWEVQTSGTDYRLKDICLIDLHNAWIVGYSNDGAILLQTTNGGVTWAQQFPNQITTLNAVYFQDNLTGWACGSILENGSKKGVILYTDNGGTIWQIQHVEYNCEELFDLDFADGMGYAVGTNGVILKLIGGNKYLTFSTVQDMVRKKCNFAYTNDGRYLYAIAGKKPSPFNDYFLSDIIQRYDPKEDRWIDLTDGLIPRNNGAAEYIDELNSLFILNGNTYTNTSYTDTIERFNLSTMSLEYRTGNPYPVTRGGTAAWNGKIYVFGGSNTDGYSKRFYEYDPESDIWTRLPDMPEPKETQGEIINGVLYVFGGTNYFNSKKIHAYDIHSGTWSYLGDLPQVATGYAITGSDPFIWIIGSKEDLNFIGSFDTRNQEFSRYYSNLIGRQCGGTEVVNDELIVFGGTQTESYESIMKSTQKVQIGDLIHSVSHGIRTNTINAWVYPNPFDNQFDIVLNQPVSGWVSIQIYAATGKMQWEKTFVLNEKDESIRMGTTDFPSGLYFYSLWNGARCIGAGKLIKI